MGLRRMGSTQRKTMRVKVKRRNRARKIRERVSRDLRMLEIVKGKSLPYQPWVMSWLCDKLDKPSKVITQADVEGLVKAADIQHAA